VCLTIFPVNYSLLLCPSVGPAWLMCALMSLLHTARSRASSTSMYTINKYWFSLSSTSSWAVLGVGGLQARIEVESGSGYRLLAPPHHVSIPPEAAWRISSGFGATFSLLLMSVLKTWSSSACPRLQLSMCISMAESTGSRSAPHLVPFRNPSSHGRANQLAGMLAQLAPSPLFFQVGAVMRHW